MKFLKKMAPILCVCCLLISLTITAHADSATESLEPYPEGISLYDVDSHDVQVMIAKLKAAQAAVCKEQSEIFLAEVEKHDQLVGFIEEAGKLREEALQTGNATEMPAEMAAYCLEMGIIPDSSEGDSFCFDAEQWDSVISDMNVYLESMKDERELQVCYLQDFIGQYKAFLAAANSAIAEENQSLTEIATGRSVGNEERQPIRNILASITTSRDSEGRLIIETENRKIVIPKEMVVKERKGDIVIMEDGRELNIPDAIGKGFLSN